jgi:hypothetical protein
MKKIFTFRIWASIFMILTAAISMNAQTDKPWHVVVLENSKEVASHSVEIITDLQVASENVTFVLDDGRTFDYPITSTFTFEERTGKGTANEVVAAPQWGVYYNGNSLHFTESVNSVAVYSVSGILIAKVSGNYTDVPVNLAKGIYIVQAGGKTVKLLVSNNGGGAAYAQPAVSETTSQASYDTPSAPSSPVTFRAANAANKQYWNVHYNNTVMAIEIAQVSNFYFPSDNSVVFTLLNGNTIQLPNYQTIDFGAQPAQPTVTSWDMNLTMLYGGAGYVMDVGAGSVYDICVIAVAKDYVVAEGVLKKIANVKIPQKDIIQPNFFTKNLGYVNSGSIYKLANYSEVIVGGVSWIAYNYYDEIYVDPTGATGIRASVFSFNGGTPIIPTTFKLNANGSLTMSFTDVKDNKAYSLTFTAP